MMRSILVALCCALAVPGGAHARGAAAAEPTVVLLHGLNRTRCSMARLEAALAARGRRVVNLGYPSAAHGVKALAALLLDRLQRCCEADLARGLDFVTHSLGGILVRALAARVPALPIRRVVMLAPPNRGSELADVLRDSAAYRLLTGPVGQQLGTGADSVPNRLGAVDFELGIIDGRTSLKQLGTGADSVPNRLGAVDFELGIIAGRTSLNPLHSWLIPGPDDGTVAVARTRVDGMRDHVLVDASHSFIVYDPEAVRQALHFLDHGRFDHRIRSP